MDIDKRLAALLPIVDEKIRPLVEGLTRRGIITASSCEGHLGMKNGACPGVAVGYWFSDPTPEEVESLIKLLYFVGKWNIEKGKHWILLPYYGKSTDGPVCKIWVKPAEMNLEGDLQILQRLQEEAKEFGEFLSNQPDMIPKKARD